MHRKSSGPSGDKILPSGGQITNISRSTQKMRAVPPLLSLKDDIVDNMKRDMIMADKEWRVPYMATFWKGGPIE